MTALALRIVPPSGDDLFNRRETADYLRCSVSTLERMALDGSGPKFSKIGSKKKRARVVYRRSDIEAWLAANRFGSTSEYPQ